MTNILIMETTECKIDLFYEDRYKQLKNDLFIGDDTHIGDIGLADMQLERLFDESLKAENVLCHVELVKNMISRKRLLNKADFSH